MTWKHKLVAIGAALAIALFAAFALRSHFRMETIERSVENAKRVAVEQKLRSDELEKQTHIYKEKAEYLESELSRIRAAAKEQDNELEKLASDTDAARRALDRLSRGPNRKQ